MFSNVSSNIRIDRDCINPQDKLKRINEKAQSQSQLHKVQDSALDNEVMSPCCDTEMERISDSIFTCYDCGYTWENVNRQVGKPTWICIYEPESENIKKGVNCND